MDSRKGKTRSKNSKLKIIENKSCGGGITALNKNSIKRQTELRLMGGNERK